MTRDKQYEGLDYFKAAAAFLVMAIHTSPLASFSEEADFIFTRVIARTAVPFFFMVTGYFLLPQYLFRRSMDRRPLLQSIKKHVLLYVAAILLYLPVNLYVGHFDEMSVGSFFRMLFVDGSFYHLWYLPAASLGIVIVWFLGIRLPFGALAGISVVLYAVGLFSYPESGGDYVRAGIALYGLLSENKRGRDEERIVEKLRPVLSLRTRIAVVKEVYAGESIGYGCAYVAEDTRKIAVLAIGYADGLPRSLSDGRGRVLIHGQSAPVLGRICMDQTIVDITEIPGVKAGEIAAVIGRSGDQEITAYEWAESAGTITNEILSRIGGRVQRIVI